MLSSKELKETAFDYIALGHIHKKSYNDYENQKIVYPGSAVSLGFDELGDRGVILGDIEKNSLKLEFIKIDSKEFKEMELDITNIESEEELIENINNLELDDNFYKIILVGKRNFDINTQEILKFIEQENIIKIKNHTTIKYDIEQIANNTSLKGIFAKNILNKINKEDTTKEEKEKLLNAFEIGMEVLN